MAVEPDEAPEVRLAPQFEGFYRDHFAAVVALAYALTRSRGAAEEVAQEAFLRAYRDWNQVARMEFPSAWVRRVAMNLAFSRFRRFRADTRAMLKLEGDRGEAFETPEIDGFWLEVRRLPRRQAQAIVLHYSEDMPVGEIAAVLGLAEGTVKALLHQGRDRLRRQLVAKGWVDDEV